MFAVLELMERDIEKQQLGWTGECIIVVSCLQSKTTVTEGGLDAPRIRRTMGSRVRNEWVRQPYDSNIREHGTPATPRIYRLQAVMNQRVL